MVKTDDPFNLNPSQNNCESHSSEWLSEMALLLIIVSLTMKSYVKNAGKHFDVLLARV